MYEKGVETKNHIYTIAKELYYEYGYKKTTMRIIAEHANVPIALITYYFKSKDNIVKDIYTDYIKNIYTFLDSVTEGNIKSSLLRHTISSRIYYKNILENEKNSRFCYELTLKHSNYGILYYNVKKTYRRILNEFSIFLPSEEYKAYIISEFGARQELLLNYFSGDLNFTIQELVDVIVCIAPRLFKIDYNIINSVLYSSMSIYKSLDNRNLEKVKFLV
ncbi:MAG: TetR/AcrR family transcriptional regulator [Eubacteriaceae bacterium]